MTPAPTTAAPDLARVVADHLFEMAVWDAHVMACGGDREAAKTKYLAGVADDLPSLALAVWVGAAACGVEFSRVAFG